MEVGGPPWVTGSWLRRAARRPRGDRRAGIAPCDPPGVAPRSAGPRTPSPEAEAGGASWVGFGLRFNDEGPGPGGAMPGPADRRAGGARRPPVGHAPRRAGGARPDDGSLPLRGGGAEGNDGSSVPQARAVPGGGRAPPRPAAGPPGPDRRQDRDGRPGKNDTGAGGLETMTGPRAGRTPPTPPGGGSSAPRRPPGGPGPTPPPRASRRPGPPGGERPESFVLEVNDHGHRSGVASPHVRGVAPAG